MPEFSLIQKIIIFAVPVVFAITVHEVAHGWMASRLGDQTARLLGRLTLNPLKHVDPIGTVALPVILILMQSPFLFGWAKPVPVDWRNLRHPRRDMAWVAAAGPAANLLMLAIWTLLAWLLVTADAIDGYGIPMMAMAMAGITINIVLMVLNLLPIPPLDGSRVVSALLPPRAAAAYNRLEAYGLMIVLILLATGILGRIMMPLVYIFQRMVDRILF